VSVNLANQRGKQSRDRARRADSIHRGHFGSLKRRIIYGHRVERRLNESDSPVGERTGCQAECARRAIHCGREGQRCRNSGPQFWRQSDEELRPERVCDISANPLTDTLARYTP
jgi:hypothetical protein